MAPSPPKTPPPIPNPVRVPLHEAIAQFRHFDGTSDVNEFLERFLSDLDFLGYSKEWAIRNLDLTRNAQEIH